MSDSQPPFGHPETDEQARQRVALAEQSRIQEARRAAAAGIDVGSPQISVGPPTAAKAATKTPAHLVADETKKQAIAALEDQIKVLKGETKPAVQEYPKWRHHATRGPVLVTSKAEETALGAGFQDSPIVPKEKP